MNVVQPYEVTIFDTLTVHELKTDTIRVPVNFGYSGLISNDPVTIEDRNFVVTSFDLDANAFVQRKYSVPARRFFVRLWSYTTYSNAHQELGMELDMTFRERLSFVPFIGFQNQVESSYLIYGGKLKYKIF